jgi:transposase
MTPAVLEALTQWIEERPDLTLMQLAANIMRDFQISASTQAISKALTKIGFTVKLLRVIPIGRNCPATVLARKLFAQKYLGDAPTDPRNIIWVDETGFNLHLRRRCGRARSGERASISVTNSRGANISVCASMSCEGFLHEMLRPGAYNAESFCAYLRDLFDLLRNGGRSQCWIILDNARFHHCQIVHDVAAQYDHILTYLPPYSPMLNPIESLFGKWKSLVRTQHVTLTRDALLAQMALCRREISRDDCLGWIRDMNRNIGLSLQDHIFQ